jgi:hypothetical protein
VTNINVTSKKTNRSVSLKKNFGSNLDEARELFGDAVVFTMFEALATNRCQAAVRATLDNPENTEDDAVAAGENYTPGVTRRRGRAGATAMNKVLEAVQSGKLSKEQVVEFLQNLQAAQAEEEE